MVDGISDLKSVSGDHDAYDDDDDGAGLENEWRAGSNSG